MQQIKYIIQKEFIQVFRDKAMLRIMFIAPIIQLILLGYAVTTDIKNIPMLITDLDNSQISRELINGFKHSGYFNVNYYETDRHQIAKYLDSGQATIALSIPHNFSVDLQQQLQPKIQILLDGQDSNSSLVALGYANGIIQSFISDKLQNTLQSKPMVSHKFHVVQPEINIWYNPNLIAKNYMVPGIVVLLLTIITTILTSMGIVREREIGTLEQLMVTPIKPYQLMIGKTVPFAILGFIEVIFALSVAKLWYDIPIIGNLGTLALFAIIFMFTTLGLGILISTISKTQQQALFLAWFVMVFAIIMSGFLFPIENMPKSMQYLSYINPVRYFITVVRELFLKGSGLTHLWPQGLIMLIFSIVILTVSSIRFQKRMN